MISYIDSSIFNSRKVTNYDKMTFERLQEALFSDNAIGPHLMEYLPQSIYDSSTINKGLIGFGKVLSYRTSLHADWIRNFPIATASMLAFSAVICGIDDALSTLSLITARESKAANQFVILTIGYFGFWGLKFPQLSRNSNKSISKFCIQGVQFLSSMMTCDNNDNNTKSVVENLNGMTILSLLVSCSWCSKEEDMQYASEFRNVCGKLLRAYVDSKSIEELWSLVRSLLPPLDEETISNGNSHSKISSFLTWFGANTTIITATSSLNSNSNSSTKRSSLLMVACNALESVAAADVQEDDDESNNVEDIDANVHVDSHDENEEYDDHDHDHDDDDEEEVELMFQLDNKGDNSILASLDASGANDVKIDEDEAEDEAEDDDSEDALQTEVDQSLNAVQNDNDNNNKGDDDDDDEVVSSGGKFRKTKSNRNGKGHGKRKKTRV